MQPAAHPLGFRPVSPSAMRYRNLIGPQVRKLRYQRDWSQTVLAAKLQIAGWEIDRVGVAKIEARLVHVDEFELLYFLKVFRVGFSDLFPPLDPTRPLQETLTELMTRKPPAACSHSGTSAAPTSRTLPRADYGTTLPQSRPLGQPAARR